MTVVKDGVRALIIVLVLTVIFAICFISAMQDLKPKNMPFGVTESSPVVTAVESEESLDVITYSSESDLLDAAERGDIYGGYIVGDSSDTIVTVPAKSFFGEVYVRAAFADAAEKAGRDTTTKVVAPLPLSDRTGAVVGLLMLPTLIGGYLIATMLFSFTKRAAVAGRIGLILLFSIVVALITGAAALVTGAIAIGDIWRLLPGFALVTTAVALTGVAIQHFLGKMGTLVIALLFIVIGGASAGGVGPALLPGYWQVIGAFLPPRHAVELYRNILYFDGNNTLPSILVLVAYAVIGGGLIIAAQCVRATSELSDDAVAADAAVPTNSSTPRRKLLTKEVIAPVSFAVLLTAIFGFNYMSAGHQPVAANMPFGLVGSSTLPHDAQGSLFSLNVISYADEDAAKTAMQQGKIYGALITSDTAGTPDSLLVVPSISDISPLDITANFEKAAETAGESITVSAYTPTPLAPGDPFALVSSILLIPILVGGYMATSMLTNSQNSASGRWRGVYLLGFAIVTAVVTALITVFWFKGLPTAAFWILIPIITLVILCVALIAAVMRRILGPVGIFLTVIIVIQFGNPSSGGANGSPYLPPFWDALGPFLPPRNAYLLIRDAAYFGGNNIAEPLTILLIYVVICATLLAVFDWFIDKPALTTPGIKDSTSAAVLAPVGPLP